MRHSSSVTFCWALLCVCLACGPSRRAGDFSNSSRELEQMLAAWDKAWLEKDASTVDRLLGADFVYIAPNGQIVRRGEMLGFIRSPGYHLKESIRTEIQVKPIGEDSAAIVHRWQGAGEFNGVADREDNRCMMVCSRRSGSWQLVLDQCSSIANTK